jgi:hypothetical protein
MKFGQLLKEVFDLKAFTDTVANIGNQLKGLQGQVPEIQKLQQDNLQLTKKLDDMSKNDAAKAAQNMQNKTGVGTVAKTGIQKAPGGSSKATYGSTAPASGAPTPPQ